MKINPILARFENDVALVCPERQSLFESCAEAAAVELNRISDDKSVPTMASANDDFWYHPSDWRAQFRPYVVRDGILEIPVKGVLLNDFPYAFGSWATGYDYIRRAFDRGIGDTAVRGIILVIDSPGGMVAGNFDLVDHIYAKRGVKPISAIASEHAYSAAYSLGSVADPGKFYVARTGGVGSIGVVTSHVDVSEALTKDGVKITFIHAGRFKVEGNPFEPLSPDAKARIQARIDAMYQIFVSTVARNRGLDEQAVRETEALTFIAADALSNGLADKIGSYDDALADFSASLSPNHGDDHMADVTQADHDKALADAATAAEATQAAAVATASAAAVTAERERIGAILQSEEGKARPAAAAMLAFDTDKDSASAIASLAKLPAESAATTTVAPTAGAPAGQFAAAMSEGNPDLTVGGDDDADGAKAKTPAALAASFGVAGF